MCSVSEVTLGSEVRDPFWRQGLDGLVCNRSPRDSFFRTPGHVCAEGQSSQHWAAATHSPSCS